MIGIVNNYDKEFYNTPRNGWKNGQFYLISGGGKIKRIYSKSCNDIPIWAWKLSGAPEKPQIICNYCGKNNATLVSGKYCNKCGKEVQNG